jgi:glyoxylase-like metal-dependent hydrolase (beta-lactamase superfamily II)
VVTVMTVVTLSSPAFPFAFAKIVPRCTNTGAHMNHKTPITLACLSLALGLAAAQDQDFSKVQIKVSKVAGNVYMLEGAGGNIGASVGDDGVVLVDDQDAPLAEKIQAAVRDITDKPVRFIINTHYHGDHIGGNAYFQKQAPVIAHDNVRKRLETGGTTGNGGSISRPAPSPKTPCRSSPTIVLSPCI